MAALDVPLKILSAIDASRSYIPDMKTAYELAMERLSMASPVVKTSPAQKKKLAELDSKYSARFAEREIFLKGEMEQAAARQEWETLQQLEKQLISEKKSLAAELEEKKAIVRQGGKL